MTSRDDIRSWLREGKSQDATHVIVVVDEFDHDDYPVFVQRGEDAAYVAKRLNAESMQRVMECYALHLDIEMQLNEPRSYHYESAPTAMELGRAVHKHIEEAMAAVVEEIPPTSLYHKLLAKVGKTHEQVQANLQAEHEERARLAAHEATRPRSELDARVADHLFIEALIELCQKHNRSIAIDIDTEDTEVHTLDENDTLDLRALDPLTHPVPFPEAKGPYR